MNDVSAGCTGQALAKASEALLPLELTIEWIEDSSDYMATYGLGLGTR
jgi:hypothetical protein|eukprot:COSAG01_NODE_685_length_14250_cov_18.752032_10_plen_48_part_00